MELSGSTVTGLQLAGSSSIDDKSFNRLTQLVLQSIMEDTDPSIIQDDGKLSKINQGMLKECYSSLIILLIEGARTDTDTTGMRSTLEDCKLTPDRIEVLVTLYNDNKAKLRARLGRIRSSFPYLTDVNWRLDYYIKSNHLERVDKPVYTISLNTEEGDGKKKDVIFSCTQEQLQDLVGKLKDASKSLEKFSQQ
ncbi:PREDICTED: COMM domain-containing protein 3-like [Amphimedon queenslandica]|uniref:COMM domain-containing protein 3 n=1 Tax=Amphimedon queenslandica TaxID=400682 RepID=A0A1X7TPU2_AMPQE|nr:PREDICTED: COMM domain-containing protein 3-like [Amphimedon queenslandica]|eukprot:XP_011407076.1 PREDICTED: COMM domain-containing protein 3-like [Amphimedon queenslandica]